MIASFILAFQNVLKEELKFSKSIRNQASFEILYLKSINRSILSIRLPPVQQPRERHHRAPLRLLRRGGHGLLHQLPQDAIFQAQQAHHSLLLQRGK